MTKHFFWHMERILTCTTTMIQSRLKSNSNEGALHIPQTPGLEPHHQMQFSVTPRTHFKYCYLTINSIQDLEFVCTQF